MASPTENGGYLPSYQLNMNGLNLNGAHPVHGHMPSIYHSLPRSPLSPGLNGVNQQQSFSAWPVGSSFGPMHHGPIIEEGSSALNLKEF